jgi:hypothetical protein
MKLLLAGLIIGVCLKFPIARIDDIGMTPLHHLAVYTDAGYVVSETDMTAGQMRDRLKDMTDGELAFSYDIVCERIGEADCYVITGCVTEMNVRAYERSDAQMG